MFYNAEWFARLLNGAFKAGIHMTWLGDSTGTAGASTTFCPDYIGALSQWRPPCQWAGMQLPDLSGTAQGHSATNTPTTTSTYGAGAVVGGTYNGLDGYASCFPGMLSPEGNTDGRTVGSMTRWTFNANRATDGALRTSTLPDNGWLESDALWMRRALKARMYGLRHPNGPAEMRIYGQRGGASGTGVNYDLSIAGTGGVDETLIAMEANIAAGAGSAGVLFAAGAGNETDKDVVIGMPMIYDPNARGLIMDTIAVGSWGVLAYSDSAGMAVTGPSYTAKFSDAALEQYFAVSAIAGTRRILFVQIGQNDAAQNEATFKANLTTLITRMRARFVARGLDQPAFILRSAPDPGYTGIVDSRFDGFDRTVKSLAETMTTAASPIMACCSREILGAQKTITGQFGAAALADSVHRSVAGAQKFEALFWRMFQENVYKPMFGRGGGRYTR